MWGGVMGGKPNASTTFADLNRPSPDPRPRPCPSNLRDLEARKTRPQTLASTSKGRFGEQVRSDLG